MIDATHIDAPTPTAGTGFGALVGRVRAALDADRPAAIAIAVLGLVYGFAWRWTTRPMGDSSSYRDAGRVLRDGWHLLSDRTAGYPLLLWLTGSLDGETHALFVSQLVLHAVSVWLVVRVLGHLGAPQRARLAAAALLLTPPVMLGVVYSGSEVLTEVLVALTLWAFVRWHVGGSASWLVGAGVFLGAAVWVRPSFAALIAPVALVVWSTARRGSRTRRPVVSLVAPAAVIIGALFVVNAVRFDSATLTPLTGWYLGSRTSTFVDELPESYEPARRILVAERDRQLLRTDEFDAPNYSFAVRDDLRRALGYDDRRLDDYVLDLNLYLITHHPFEYVETVVQTSPGFVGIDSRPAINGLGRPVTWLWMLLHWALLAVFLVVAGLVPGLVLLGRVERRVLVVLGFVTAVAGTVFVTSIATETGTARLRSPVEPLLVVGLVLGARVVGEAVRDRRARR